MTGPLPPAHETPEPAEPGTGSAVPGPVPPAPPVQPHSAPPVQPYYGPPPTGYAVPTMARPGYPQAVPPGAVPPGAVPPGAVPPGAVPPGAVPPGMMPPGYPVRWVPLAPDGRPLANFGERLVAFLVDAVILGAVGLVFMVPLMIWWISTMMTEMTRLQTSIDRGDTQVTPDFGGFFLGYLAIWAGLMVILMLVSYLYLVELSWKSGQTLGKKIMKLEIAPIAPGTPRTRVMFVKRWAVERVAGAFVPFFSYVDGLWQLWDKPFQQCLHDKAAQTVVVKIG